MKKQKLKLLTVSCLLLSGFFLTALQASFGSFQSQFLPIYQHYLSAVQTNGEMIEIDDGSIWKINRYHARRTLYWHTNDVLEITPTNAYRGERFYITNKTKNGDYVLAELSNGPLYDCLFTNEITNIYSGEIFLMSGSGIESRFVIDPKDTFKLVNWNLRQAIIIGKNNRSWFHWGENDEVILINPECNEYIRATIF